MSLLAFRTAVVADIETEMTTLRTCQAHGGKFDLKELKRWAIRAPAVLVSVLGIPTNELDGGAQSVGHVKMAAFVVASGTSAIKRDAEALGLVESLIDLVLKNNWDYEHAAAPSNVKADNLYGGKIDHKGVALWAVSWTQRLDMAIFDSSTLNEFKTLQTKWDLVPADGVFELEDMVLVRSDLMSAYGHIYVSTPVATAIAVVDTYQKAAGTTTLKLSDDTDMPVVGRLRHTGTVAKPFLVSGACSVTVDSNAKVTLALAEGGVVDENTEVELDVVTTTDPKPVPLSGLFSLDENEYVEIWVKADDTVNVTLTKANLVIAAD